MDLSSADGLTREEKSLLEEYLRWEETEIRSGRTITRDDLPSLTQTPLIRCIDFALGSTFTPLEIEELVMVSGMKALSDASWNTGPKGRTWSYFGGSFLQRLIDGAMLFKGIDITPNPSLLNTIRIHLAYLTAPPHSSPHPSPTPHPSPAPDPIRISPGCGKMDPSTFTQAERRIWDKGNQLLETYLRWELTDAALGFLLNGEPSTARGLPVDCILFALRGLIPEGKVWDRVDSCAREVWRASPKGETSSAMRISFRLSGFFLLMGDWSRRCIRATRGVDKPLVSHFTREEHIRYDLLATLVIYTSDRYNRMTNGRRYEYTTFYHFPASPLPWPETK